MNESKDTPALVIGTGPVGLTAALALHAQGVPVRIIGNATGCSTKSKALVIWSRTLEDLAGLIDLQSFSEAGTQLRGMRIHSGSHELVSLQYKDMPALSRFPPGILIPQYETERLLVQRLEACEITVEWETELVSFSQNDHEVEVRLRGPGGVESVCKTPWLIAADGAHSTVRHQLEVEFTGDTLPTTFYIADVHLGADFPEGEGVTYLDRHGVCMLLPIGGTQHTRVIATAPNSDEASVDPTLPQIQEVLDRALPMDVTASDPMWLASFRIRERVLEEFRHGRVFLAGDAAHTHSPAGGHGMNTGMQDAFNLAWKIGLHHRGIGGDDLLDSYSDERKHVARKVVTDSNRLTKVMAIDSPVLSLVRSSGLKLAGSFDRFRNQVSRNLQMMDLDYQDTGLPRVSSISRNHDALSPGMRLPLLEVSAAEQRATTLDAEHDPSKFSLFVIENDRTPSFDKALRSAQATIEGLAPEFREVVNLIAVRVAGTEPIAGVTLLHDVDGQVQQATGFRGHGAMLVRPDRIVSVFCGALDGRELDRWFQGL
ncbi:MAG: hypothetical protein CBC35_02515 [Planctomycetes bacterium TMED75]|nr:FAD-binding monooxygenase [Planctomycetaceae bacterium]OUU95737.1 MAG: hypothetical protein CBC35_02515 [Planctomycetes bacterium TMED75]